ncbi:xanthine dehydrogenase accessory protein XdhC [Pseudooctadecabacter sp.]|uniref:xanthine dehydrogenase accessory protein XdhC n=1 Tax=Pseudooctadecabacter sp. TaxID=1966338 RepID=UPI0035C85A66
MTDVVTITVASTRGSAPRDAGTFMEVSTTQVHGTIGGGALEYEAIRLARQMIRGGSAAMERVFPLGPDLGQCCGGSVTLTFAKGAGQAEATAPPLWIWGAGHVGRAIGHVMAPFADREITIVDTTSDRMPQDLPGSIAPLVAAAPVRVVPRAPDSADHIIVTYSHDLDLALCDALLRRGFGSCGLIGSATKWGRFRRRLASMGHEDAQIARIACPIGNPALGKHPQAIAVGVAAALISPVAVKAMGDKTG